MLTWRSNAPCTFFGPNVTKAPRFITRPLSGLGSRACRCGLARERFTQHLRCHRPFHESWHKCVHEAIQSARNYSGPVFPQRVKALGYALLHAHRLHRHGPRVEPKLGQHGRVCQRGRHDGNVDAPRLELVVKRFPTVDSTAWRHRRLSIVR